MHRSKVGAGAVLVLVVMVVSGCASTKGIKAPLVDSVSVVYMSDKDVRTKFGSSYSENPFIRRAGTVTGTPYDFIDAKLSIVTDAGASVEILQAKVVDKDNKTRAWLYDRAQFVDIVKQLSNPDDLNGISKRQNIANWYYIPSNSLR